MIQAFLELPAVAQFVAIAVVYCGCAVLIAAITMWWPTKAFFSRFRGVVAPFFSSVAILFGLLTGFLASDVSARNRAARESVTIEANSLIALHALSIAAPSDLSAIREAMRAFIHSELTDEWPSMAGRGGSPATDSAYRALLEKVSAPSVASAGQSVHSNLLAAALQIGTARSNRLSITFDRSDDVKWICVLLLALLTQFAIALVHFERRAPQAAALAVFTSAAIVALALIALQEDPFSGPLRVGPEPIAGVLQVISAS